MKRIESQILKLWEKSYQKKTQDKHITKYEALSMIANELNIDLKTVSNIQKNNFHKKRSILL